MSCLLHPGDGSVWLQRWLITFFRYVTVKSLHRQAESEDIPQDALMCKVGTDVCLCCFATEEEDVNNTSSAQRSLLRRIRTDLYSCWSATEEEEARRVSYAQKYEEMGRAVVKLSDELHAAVDEEDIAERRLAQRELSEEVCLLALEVSRRFFVGIQEE